VGFIDRGQQILSSSKDGSIKRWDCGSAECVHTFNPESGAVNAIAIHGSNGKWIILK
jgi:proteasomal ATPase-associated factor 1